MFFMKKILLPLMLFIAYSYCHAQEFNKSLTAARTAYSSGKLEDTRFAMQQMLNELDMITGKEILKLLPPKILDLQANTAKDNVSGTSGFIGVVIHRDYGPADKNIDLEIISNSPLIGSINTILSLPFIGASAEYKIIKINGYKALIQNSAGKNGNTDFELQLPLHSTLITLKAPGYTQEQVINIGNALPVAEIAKMVQ